MSNPKDKDQDPVAGPPTGHSGESAASKMQTMREHGEQAGSGQPQNEAAQCTPESLKSQGLSEELSQEIPKAVGAGISLTMILAALAQRLGPAALDVVRDLINSFSMRRGSPQSQSGKKNHP